MNMEILGLKINTIVWKTKGPELDFDTASSITSVKFVGSIFLASSLHKQERKFISVKTEPWVEHVNIN